MITDRVRVLACDGDAHAGRAVRLVLRNAGYDVDTTSTAAEAVEHAALRLPDAAIIELELPDGDGAELCRRLRDWTTMPVLVLSAVSHEEAVVRALNAGADDYLCKPFRARELVARLDASLRRAVRHEDRPQVELNDVQVDLAARIVRRGGAEIHLTPIEFKLLRALIRSHGRLVTHNTLLAQVWGRGYLDAHDVLRAHVCNLRRKLECEGRLIRTVHGVGYSLLECRHPAAQGPAPDGQPVDCTPTGAAAS